MTTAMGILGELKIKRHRIGWVFAAMLIVWLAVEGHRLAAFVPQAERAIANLGAWGPMIYVLAVLLLEPVFFPNVILGLVAGAAFGLWKGYLYYFVGVYAANMLVYLIGRRLLRRPVLRRLATRPKIRDAAAAAITDGTGLVFWLRMIPANPAILSYALGALRVLPRSVAIGTLGMAPHMFVDVYLGSAATHVTKMAGQEHTSWETKGAALMLGLVAVIVVSWRITRIARARIKSASDTQSHPTDGASG